MTTLRASVTVAAGPRTVEAALDVGERGLVLIGPNGAGKTTLLHALLGVRRPLAGRVAVDDEVLFDAGAGVHVPAEERRLAYVPQDFGLFPHLTAEGNVAFALGCRVPPLPGKARVDQARALLASLGLTERASALPATLSGGERQKVALARALAIEPRALLLDEPLAALDVEARDEIRTFLRAQLVRLRRPFVLVTHDPEDVRAFEAPVAVLEEGRLVQQGEAAALQTHPSTPFVSRFFGRRQ